IRPSPTSSATRVANPAASLWGGHRVDLYRVAPGFELGRAVRLDTEGLAEPLPRVLVDQDRPADDLGMRLEVGGEIHALAHTGIGHAVLGPRESGDERDGGDADRDPDLAA